MELRGLSVVDFPVIFDLTDLKERELPTVSVLLRDGPDVKLGPLSKEVEETDFRGVFVPDPDLEGVLPISQATYPTNSVYQVRAMMIEAATDKVSRVGNRSVVEEAIICCEATISGLSQY